MAAELCSLLVHDRAVLSSEPATLEEVAIVVAGEEAGFLALPAARNCKPGALRLCSRLFLRLAAERERDAVELRRIDLREHVRLVLRGIDTAAEQQSSPVLDDACVMAGRELVGACAVCEGEQPREAEAAVAVDARVRRLPTLVTLDKRVDDRAPKLLAQVERHVRHPERVAGRTGSQHRIGRTACALGVGPIRIEPEPKRHTDRVGQRLEQRNRTVHAPTHRNRNPTFKPRSPKNRPDRIGQRISSKLLPTNGSSLEQCQPNKRPLEPRRISLNDPLTIKNKPHERKVSPTRRIPNQLNHGNQASGNRRECRLSRRSPQPQSETAALSLESHHGSAKRSRTSCSA